MSPLDPQHHESRAQGAYRRAPLIPSVSLMGLAAHVQMLEKKVAALEAQIVANNAAHVVFSARLDALETSGGGGGGEGVGFTIDSNGVATTGTWSWQTSRTS